MDSWFDEIKSFKGQRYGGKTKEDSDLWKVCPNSGEGEPMLRSAFQGLESGRRVEMGAAGFLHSMLSTSGTSSERLAVSFP